MRDEIGRKDLGQWAAEDRGCGSQAIADTLRRAEGGAQDALRAAVRWGDDGRAVVLSTVVESAESSFGPGVQLACSDDGRVIGGFNDSGLEHAVALSTLDVLRGGSVRDHRWAPTGSGDWEATESGSVRILQQPYLPPWEVVLVGSGKVPQAVGAICASVGISFRVYDDLEGGPDLPGARESIHAPYAEISRLLRLGVGSHCVVATPKHAGDPVAVGQLLNTPAVPYVGLMHNEVRAVKLVQSLREQGVVVDGRLRCPIGLAIATQNPGQIAIGILAEILAVANARKVRRMGLDWSRPDPLATWS